MQIKGIAIRFVIKRIAKMPLTVLNTGVFMILPLIPMKFLMMQNTVYAQFTVSVLIKKPFLLLPDFLPSMQSLTRNISMAVNIRLSTALLSKDLA